MIKRLKAPTTELREREREREREKEREQPGAALSFLVIQLIAKRLEALTTQLKP